MRISDKALRELETLLRNDYPDMDLNDGKLREIAINLLRNVKLVFGGTNLSNGNLYDDQS